MATKGSTRKQNPKKKVTLDEKLAVKTPMGKKVATSDENVGSGWKSPFKLRSPIFHTRTIHLHDWWLIRTGEGIGVGGFTMRKEGVETAFCSSAIKERHDPTTLETSDGFTIFISGLLNTSVTAQNGFSPKVCDYFVVGFPINWDDFVSEHAGEGSAHPGRRPAFSPSSFEAMTLLQKRDFLQSTHEDEDTVSEYLTNDLLKKLKSEKDLHKKVKDKTKHYNTRARR